MNRADTPLELVRSCQILVCVGTGGVGKTTVSAALGLLAAEYGRRTLVLTIDPARRLADALGIASLGNEPQRVDLPHLPGEYSAMMLDTKHTFDQLIERIAKDGEARARILDNPIYQHATESLSGTSEYAAMEKVLELSESGHYDLIVVDTPPAQHALDFLEAPQRLIEFLDSRLVKVLVQPAMAAGRFGMQLFQRPIHAVLSLIERITGVGFLEDLSEFLLAIDDLSDGFKARADRIQDALRGDHAGFVLIAGPGPESVVNAQLFVAQLDRIRIPLRGVVVNRMRSWPPGGAPSPALLSHSSLEDEINQLAKALADPPDTAAAGAVVAAARAQAERARDDRQACIPLYDDAETRGCFFREIPELPEDVHDLEGLAHVTRAIAREESVADG